MSNHFSAADIKSPGGDARLDFTDLFAFLSPADQDKTVVIMDSNPFFAGKDFHPQGIYRLHIDRNNDARADAAISVVFSEMVDGKQTGTVYYAVGRDAQSPEPCGEVIFENVPVSFGTAAQVVSAGPCRMFAGARSDPFFADGEGPFHDFEWTHVDTFLGKNVLSIALELPNDMLNVAPEVGLWATISLDKDGVIKQMDRGGNPTINPFLNADDVKDAFNAGEPADDVAEYHDSWAKLLEKKGGYSPKEARQKALLFLPDILHYDRDEPAHYPNGRVLTDDVYTYRFAWLTNGKAGPQGIKPHDDLLAQFPFLGAPNPIPKSA
jgi:hypothetical protein